MSINKLVSTRRLAVSLFEDIGETGINAPTISRWAKDADFKIGNFRSWTRNNFVGTVSSQAVELPDASVHVSGIIMGNYETAAEDIFMNCYHANQSILANDANYPFNWNMQHYSPISCPYKIVNNQIVFENTIMDDREVTVDLISYQVDADGYIMVPEINLDAIQAYLEWKYAKKVRWSKFKKGKLSHMDNNMLQELKFEYHRQVRGARAKDEVHGVDQTVKTISEMINNPLKGFGNAIIHDLWL